MTVMTAMLPRLVKHPSPLRMPIRGYWPAAAAKATAMRRQRTQRATAGTVGDWQEQRPSWPARRRGREGGGWGGKGEGGGGGSRGRGGGTGSGESGGGGGERDLRALLAREHFRMESDGLAIEWGRRRPVRTLFQIEGTLCREGRQGVSPEKIVEAIWAHWEKHLGRLGLEGSVANAQAREGGGGVGGGRGGGGAGRGGGSGEGGGGGGVLGGGSLVAAGARAWPNSHITRRTAVRITVSDVVTWVVYDRHRRQVDG